MVGNHNIPFIIFKGLKPLSIDMDILEKPQIKTVEINPAGGNKIDDQPGNILPELEWDKELQKRKKQ
jgi:hypothetical protein